MFDGLEVIAKIMSANILGKKETKKKEKGKIIIRVGAFL